MGRKFLLVSLLLVGLFAVGWFALKKSSGPEDTQEKTGSGSIGYIGCSNTRETVEGYHRVGGKEMWSYDKRYDAGAVLDWARDAETGNRYWDVFDELLEENPGTKTIWWQLCIRGDEKETNYEHTASILEAIRKRIPDAVVYVSPLPPYTEGVCEITGMWGIEKARELAQKIDLENEDVLPGPVLGPMTPTDTASDGCHLKSPDGKRKLGEQMKEFFDQVAAPEEEILAEKTGELPPVAPPTEPKEPKSEGDIWQERVDNAFAPAVCPAVSKETYPDSYYKGPLTDTHFHIPAIPDWTENSPDDDPEARFGGPQALLGWNVTMSEIACALQSEGTTKNFAFFPVYDNIPEPLLEVVDRTIETYPALFTPFIMTPGPDDVTPTLSAEAIQEALTLYPDLFRGYGEIGLYEIRGVRGDFPPDDAIFENIYPIVREHGLTVYFHPGEEHTDNFERVLREHPDINFIVHGDEIQGDIISLMDEYPNIYYGVDAFWGADMDLFHLFVGESKETYLDLMEKEFDSVLEYEVAKWKPKIEKHPDRFLWGTDRGDAVWNYDVEVGQSMVKFARAFTGRLDPAVQEKFAYKNAENVLR